MKYAALLCCVLAMPTPDEAGASGTRVD